MFKGTVPKGTKVEAELTLGATSSGTASLFIGHSSGSGGDVDSTTVAPGGTGSVSITPDSQGLLRVLVDVHRESDEGRLEVKPVTAAEDIQGDTTWTYAVG